MEERLRQLEGRVRKREHDAHDDGDVDMDGFMIVDSVGDVDGEFGNKRQTNSPLHYYLHYYLLLLGLYY
jgi:hypothetical protein